MRLYLTTLMICGTLTVHAASEAVSSAFIFDASYHSLGGTSVWEMAVEAIGLSDLFTTRTVDDIIDTDRDGLPDVWELFRGLDPYLADADADPDHDGFTNRMEYNAGTDPNLPDVFANSIVASRAFTADLRAEYVDTGAPVTPTEVWFLSDRFLADTIGISPDTDGDGMRDDWEIAHGLNPLFKDGDLDPDGDGRTNLEEYNAGTHPNTADLWNLSLLASATFLTDTHIPYTPVSLPLVEETYVIFFEGKAFVCDTGGLYYDWDGDGIPNWWEARYANSKTGLSASDDPDNDGYSNGMEYLAYTDPTDARSVFAISQIRLVVEPPSTSIQALKLNPAFQEQQSEPAVSDLLLTWLSAANRQYSVYTSTDLVNWDPDPILTIDGTGELITVEIPQSQSSQFFRIKVDFIQ